MNKNILKIIFPKNALFDLFLFSLFILFLFFLQWGQIDQVFKTVSKNYLFGKEDYFVNNSRNCLTSLKYSEMLKLSGKGNGIDLLITSAYNL